MNAALSQEAHPLVTVVTVVYNLVKGGREEFFRQCVESVHAQDYPAVEHLVIDGASDDGTRELVREYEKVGWLTCVSEPDEGIYDAMNKGLSLARGKYISFLNSDDLWHDAGGIRMSVRLLELAQADFSYAPTRFIKQDGSFSNYWGALPASFVSNHPFCHQTMFARVERLRQLGGFAKERYRIAADYDLITSMLLRGAKPVYVPHCFTSFRLGGFSADDSVVQAEVAAVHRYHYGPFIGEKEAEKLRSGQLPVKLFQLLQDLLHPSVAQELREISVRSGSYVHLVCDVHSSLLEEVALMKNTGVRHEPCEQQEKFSWKGRVLGILPVKVRHEEKKCRVSFCGISLACQETKGKGIGKSRRVWKLFQFLPVLTRTVRASTVKYYLFGVLPLFTMKRF